MRQMVADGEVNALVPDRVWKETQTALAQGNARVYFETLRMSGALGVVYPEIDALFGVPQPAEWHPEIDTGLHTMMALEQAEKLSTSLEVRFAALVHDLGKATTDKSRLPSHPGHELRSVRLILKFVERLPVPKQCRDLGLLVAEFHTHCHRAFELRPATVLKMLERCDAFRRPERFEHFLLACEADARGRAGLELHDYPQADYLRAAYSTANSVDNSEILAKYDGAAISKELSKRRQTAIARLAGSRNT
jgi:tRNA nucleotidyltransferase (CCA-adding enzyme)